MSTYDYTFKIMLLGNDPIGKTSLAKRYCYNIFNPSERLTIGVDFHVKTIELNGRRLKLQIWDVGGEERFRFLLPTYCLGANAAMFLFDITNPHSLDCVAEWVQIIRQGSGDIPIVLIGTKLHLQESRVISREEGILTAENYHFSGYAEISSVSGQNVSRTFEFLTELAINRAELVNTTIRASKKFKVNDHLILKLENNTTKIYVGGKLFQQCKFLLLNVPIDSIRNCDEINSIDEAAEKLDSSLEGRGSSKYYISPETEFWGHCSNLQAWYENDYDTRILHRNLAFPLLKALVKAGDRTAKAKFKEQVALRLESGYPSVVMFLVNKGYLNYLTEEEVDTILKNPKFLKNVPKWFNNFKNIPDWLGNKIRAIFNDLKCPYCNIKIKKSSVQRILKGESLRCEFCYSSLI